jgi:molybdenum cofactor cytidylyltransferase
MGEMQAFPWAIVLAAGASRRFGGDKLAVDAGGAPLISRVLAALEESRRRGDIGGVVVVTREGDHGLAALAGEGVEVLPLPLEAPAGLSASLNAGIASLDARRRPAPPAAALLCLADQPGLRPDVVSALVAAWREGVALVLRPRYAEAPGVPGHPVLIDRTLWPLAAEATGDAGLGPVLARRPGQVRMIDVPGRNPDIDTPADLAAFLRAVG